MTVQPATRRANLWLFLGLVVFAIALCALVLLWMRARTRAMGGAVYPPTSWRQETMTRDQNSLLEIAPVIKVVSPLPIDVHFS